MRKTFTGIKQLAEVMQRKSPIKRFSTKSNPRGPDINSILKNNLTVIENEESLKDLFLKS